MRSRRISTTLTRTGTSGAAGSDAAHLPASDAGGSPAQPLPGAASHRGHEVSALSEVRIALAHAAATLADVGVPYVVIGGQASALLGRARASCDIDLLVKPEDVGTALQAFATAGFKTEEVNPNWLHKAFRGAVLIDVLFKTKGDIYLDDEMLEHAVLREAGGRLVHVMAPEDLLVIKALAHDEETSRHWFDALGLIAANRLDWPYLLRRAAKGPRRVLSLLVYATSVDLVVPADVVRRLQDDIFARGE